jgi:hypothetical protein
MLPHDSTFKAWPDCGKRTADAAQAITAACFEVAAPSPMAFARSAQAAGLALQPGMTLSNAAAVFWDILCEHFATCASRHGAGAASARGSAIADHETSSARRHHDALEQIVPDPLALLTMVAEHAAAPEAKCSAAVRLMAVARTCVDFGDASARDAAEPLCSKLAEATHSLRCTFHDTAARRHTGCPDGACSKS